MATYVRDVKTTTTKGGKTVSYEERQYGNGNIYAEAVNGNPPQFFRCPFPTYDAVQVDPYDKYWEPAVFE